MELSLMQSTDAPGTKKELRNFGLLMGGMIALIFGLIIPWLRSIAWPLWPWPVAAVFVVWALAAPATLALVYRYWMKLATVLAWINSRIILGLAFYLMIFPISLILRLLGKDALARHYDPHAVSYRHPKAPRPKNHMEKPF